MKVTKILYHLFLLLDQFCFCNKKKIYYISAVRGRSECVFSILGRVPGHLIRDFAGSSNNLAPRFPKLSANDVTAKSFFERLYLIAGLRRFVLFVTMPSAFTTPLSLQLFLDFREIFLSELFTKSSHRVPVQPVPDKMRLKMLVETQIEILDGQSSYLFSHEPFKKRPGMTIEEFGLLHPDGHFESHLLWSVGPTLPIKPKTKKESQPKADKEWKKSKPRTGRFPDF